MKRTTKHIVIPINVWETADLTPSEKIVLIDIESYCQDSNGIAIGAQAISSSCGIPTKEVKQVLKSLYEKGAIQMNVSEDGEKRLTPLLYKERYIADPSNKVVVGDKPTDSIQLPWEEIETKWAEVCFMLPKITRWTPQRRTRVKACLKATNATVEDLYKVFRLIATSAFLNGSKGNGWSAVFDWVMKPNNFIKIFEGNYHKDFQERNQYEHIMHGGQVSQKKDDSDFYR